MKFKTKIFLSTVISVRFISIYILILTISGIQGLLPFAFAEIIDTDAPILRHTPPHTKGLGKKFLIRAVVEDESALRSVNLWYRTPGRSQFQKISMTKVSGNTYEGSLLEKKGLKSGIEYYIVAVDRFGNKGTDGSKNKPYFLEFGKMQGFPSLTMETVEKYEKKRPFWKNPWVWVGILAAGGGVFALSGSGGGSNGGSGTGTINVN